MSRFQKMKCRGLFAVLLFLLLLPASFAQDTGDPLGWDFDTLFDEPEADGADGGSADSSSAGGGSADGGAAQSEAGEKPLTVLSGLMRRKGFSFDASFSLYGGFNPGWYETPWNWGEGGDAADMIYSAGLGMNGGLALDFQLSDILRARTSFSFGYPGFAFAVGEFFMDYNLFNRVYFRAGKTVVNWGQSRNYTFTNLPARLPLGSSGGDSYLVKADIPVGVGGLQFLVLTRPGFMANATAPNLKELGYGAKYNAASRWLDIDLGLFFHRDMPLRFFLSLKTTVKEVELYADGMYALQYNPDIPYAFSDRNRGAASIGALRDFFGDKLTLNLELFYNGEDGAIYYTEKSDFVEAKVSPFISGWNGAVNLVVRPVSYKNFRILAKCLYSFDEKTAWLVPAVSIEPVKHVTVYLGVPMALGGREGAYYRENEDSLNRPFSVMLGITVSGSYGIGHYE